MERLLRAHGGRPETGHPPAANGLRDERKYRDEFNTEHVPEERMEYEDSIPMDRRPTLPVADVLGAYGRNDPGRVRRGRGGSHPP